MSSCNSILKSGKRKGELCGINNCKKHKLTDNITTFVELYEFLQTFSTDSIIDWLNIPWNGKDKQESLFRLFSKLGLITGLNGYNICHGNFNLGTIHYIKDKKSIFYGKRNNPLFLNDKGDSVDLVAVDEKDDKKLLCFSSKNLSKENIGKLDFEKIFFHAINYEKKNYKISYGLVVKDKQKTKKIRVEKTNKKLKSILTDNDTVFVDWNDLDQSFREFKKIYENIPLNGLFTVEKKPITFRLHQHYSILKSINLIKEGVKNILWGHICRSGKSYIITGVIIEDSREKQKCNYILLTTAPNETIEQYVSVMYCQQLCDFNIIHVNGSNMKPTLGNKNVIIVSKQFLQVLDEDKSKPQRNEKIRKLDWLSKLDIDLRFIDESHNGGTTKIVKNTLDLYGKNSTTIHISATYSKSEQIYIIPKEHQVLWDLEDITLCKKFNTERLIEKYGDEMKTTLQSFNRESVIEEYSKFPEMWIITDELDDDFTKKVIEYNNSKEQNSEKGWSTEACFLLKQNKQTKDYSMSFQNEQETLRLWYRIFGKKKDYGGFVDDDPEFPRDKVILNRIQKICSMNDSRTLGNGEPTVIMAFLPVGLCPIDKVQESTKLLLEKHNVISDYDIVCINSKKSNDPKKIIEDSLITTKRNNKKGLLVLSGRQCSLGITIEQCDIVLLLNDSSSYDMNFQMMFRCMTESTRKKFGFVVDLNIHRFITTTLLNIISSINPNEHPKKVLSYILKERIITINNDQWNTKDYQYIDKMTDNIYKVYSSNIEKTLSHFLGRLEHKQVLLSKDDGILFKNIFTDSSKFTKKQNRQLEELTEKLLNDDKENIKKGISKEFLGDDEKEENTITTEKEEQKKNLMEFLKHIIPLICILTIHDNNSSSFEEMSNYILSNQEILDVFQQQTMTWWGQNTDTNILQVFCKLFLKYLQDDTEVLQIIRSVKELFCKNVNNSKELSKLIDKYLIPHELEKKQNAEVSTPFQLRQEMLDTVTRYGDCNFWKTPKKVFEPCAGKGGFLLDVIDRFMVGLEDEEKDSEKRYKLIVEECLYWSELNPVNVFICKLLLDPYGKYQLNYHEGNTLELDIGKKWEGRVGEGFDLVVGNPPYQKNNGNKGKGNTLWNLFVKMSISSTKTIGYICLVHPKGWRQIDNSTGKLLLSKQLLYLNMNDCKSGQKIFGCSTDYDFYLLQNTSIYKETIINDYLDIEYKWKFKGTTKFIPNHSLEEVFNIIDVIENDDFLYSKSVYETRRKWISKEQTNEYKYPCVYSINSKNIPSLKWSSVNNKGHFGVSKFIFSNGQGFIHDLNGIYGMTEWAYSFRCDKKNIGYIEQTFRNKKFKKIINAIQLTSNSYNYNIIKYFKKDFWREFITEE